jgi:hypothetical protein
VQNAARQWVPTFAAPITLQASIQAVQRSKYESLGLDFQKNYIKIFAAANLINLARDSAGDRIVYGGRLYQMTNTNQWFAQDGWASCIAVDTGAFNGTIF